MSRPPTPRTTTGPKAGSWRKAASTSRPVPARKRTRSTTSAPSRRARGEAARAAARTRADASRSAAGSLRHRTTPPTSLLWRRSGETILTTASSEPEGGAQRGVDRPRDPRPGGGGARRSPPRPAGRRPRARGGPSGPPCRGRQRTAEAGVPAPAVIAPAIAARRDGAGARTRACPSRGRSGAGARSSGPCPRSSPATARASRTCAGSRTARRTSPSGTSWPGR